MTPHSHDRRQDHEGAEAGPRDRAAARPFLITFAITLALLGVEALGGWIAGSLALLADAGHLLVDAAAIAVGLIAAWLAGRPATARLSYGYRRAEILAAILNGLALWAVAGAIFFEAVRRFRTPHPVWAPGMLGVAVLGLGANLVNSGLLAPSRDSSLNLRMVFAHVLADAAAAAATIAASIIILITGWTTADAVAGAGIGLLILAGSWPLLQEAMQVLMEAAPARLSPAAVAAAMERVPGVAGVHDLHIWSVSTGLVAVSGHVVVGDGADAQQVLQALCDLLRTRYALGHVTLQLEAGDSADPWHPRCAPGTPAGSSR
jgi:cobalt-zinc-cadmium efflux system protein